MLRLSVSKTFASIDKRFDNGKCGLVNKLFMIMHIALTPFFH